MELRRLIGLIAWLQCLRVNSEHHHQHQQSTLTRTLRLAAILIYLESRALRRREETQFATVVQALKNASETESSRRTEPPHLNFARRILGSDDLLRQSADWLAVNNDKDVRNHPSFASYFTCLTTVICKCYVPDLWDEPECTFHEASVHSIADFVWGFGMALETSEAVPLSVPLVAASALVLAKGEQDRLAREAAQTPGAQHAERPAATEAVDLLAVLGKHARFLLQDGPASHEAADGDDSAPKPKQCFNDLVVNTMILGRPLYVLEATLKYMVKPEAASAAAASLAHTFDASSFVAFDDCDPLALHQVLKFLCLPASASFIMECEGRSVLGRLDAATWASAWTSLISEASARVASHRKKHKVLQVSDEQLQGFLPDPSRIFGKKADVNVLTDDAVKLEQGAGTGAGEGQGVVGQGGGQGISGTGGSGANSLAARDDEVAN